MIQGRLVNLSYSTVPDLVMNYVIRTKDTKDGKPQKVCINDIPANHQPNGFIPREYYHDALELSKLYGLPIIFKDLEHAYFSDQDGEVMQVFAKLPRHIGEFRRALEGKEMYRAYEMDWRYKLRHMCDVGYGLFVEIDDDYQSIRGITDQQTIDKLPPYRWVFLDLENDDRFGIGNAKEARILCVQCVDDAGNGTGFMGENEKEMVEDLLEYLDQYDIILSWSNYDKEFIEKRCKKIKVPINMKSWCWLDMMNLVCTRHPDYSGSSTLALEEFAREELGRGKHHMAKGFYDTWVEDPKLLLAYCLEDVRLMYDADQKYKFVELEIALGELLGLPLDELTKPTVMVAHNVFKLSQQRTRRPIWPCANYDDNQSQQDRTFRGATVLQPTPGFYKNVAILDFVSLYNNVMQMWGMSPEQWSKSTQTFGRLPDEVPVFVELLETLTAKRAEFTKQRNESTNDEEWERWDMYRKAIKPPILINWGVIGKMGSRFYIYEVAELITGHARTLLKKAIDIANVMVDDKATIYGHTDSIFINLPDEWNKETCVQESNALAQLTTKALRTYLRVDHQIQQRHLLSFKPETIFANFLLGEVKMKYSGKKIWEDGKGFLDTPKLYIRGHKKRVKSASVFVRKLQEETFVLIHDLVAIDEIVSKLRATKRELFEGKHDANLVVSTGMNMKLKDYKTTGPAVRVAHILKDQNKYLENMRVHFVFLTDKDVWPVGDGIALRPIAKSGYQHYWNNRTLTWLPEILKPFIEEEKLKRELEGAEEGAKQEGIDRWF